MTTKLLYRMGTATAKGGESTRKMLPYAYSYTPVIGHSAPEAVSTRVRMLANQKAPILCVFQPQVGMGEMIDQGCEKDAWERDHIAVYRNLIQAGIPQHDQEYTAISDHTDEQDSGKKQMIGA
jgi:hypothetical protein